jgi:hypothetical protein
MAAKFLPVFVSSGSYGAGIRRDRENILRNPRIPID